VHPGGPGTESGPGRLRTGTARGENPVSNETSVGTLEACGRPKRPTRTPLFNTRNLASLALLALLVALGIFAWSAMSGDGDGDGTVTAVGPAAVEDGPEVEHAAAPLDGPALDARHPLAEHEPANKNGTDAGEAANGDGIEASAEREAVATAFVIAGQVTDEESGDAVPGAVLLVVRADEMLASVEADERGRYRIEVEDETATHVVVRPPEGWNVREPRAPLPPITYGGRVEIAFALLRWPPPVAGDIRGTLQSEGGAWSPEDLPGPGAVVLDLVSTTTPRITLRGRLQAQEDGRGGHWLSFAFVDVPRGEYELTLSSLDNYRWHPTSSFVSPPAEGLAFLRYDLDHTLPLIFRVYERTTGEPLDEYTVRHLKLTVSDDNGVLLHTGPLDPEAFPLDAEFEWALWSEGYAPVFGDERSFEVADGERVAEVRLSWGWGARFLVMGGRGTKYPLEGVTILLDGVSVGTTREGGMLDVFRAETPSKIEVRYLDWKLTHDPLLPMNGRPPQRRGMIIPVLLEPPR